MSPMHATSSVSGDSAAESASTRVIINGAMVKAMYVMVHRALNKTFKYLHFLNFFLMVKYEQSKFWDITLPVILCQ